MFTRGRSRMYDDGPSHFYSPTDGACTVLVTGRADVGCIQARKLEMEEGRRYDITVALALE